MSKNSCITTRIKGRTLLSLSGVSFDSFDVHKCGRLVVDLFVRFLHQVGNFCEMTPNRCVLSISVRWSKDLYEIFTGDLP